MACTNGTRKKAETPEKIWLNIRDIACTFYGSDSPFCFITFPIPTQLLDVGSFCQSPPPAMPVFDLNDFLDPVTIYNKMRDVAKHLKWFDWCECVPDGPGPSELCGRPGTWTIGYYYISGPEQYEFTNPGFEFDAPYLVFSGSASVLTAACDGRNMRSGNFENNPDVRLGVATFELTIQDEPDPPGTPPPYPPELPPPPPPPPGDCSNCPPGEKGDKGDKGDPGEDAEVEFEPVNVDVLKCKSDGEFETEPVEIEVLKSDSGSFAIAFQKLFEGLRLVGAKCDPPITSTETLSAVVHPGTLIDLTDKVVRINFEVTVIPPWAGSRPGESSETVTDDLIYAGTFSLVKGLHKTPETRIQWYKQFVEVSKIDGVRLWVVPGFEITVSVEKLPED